MENNTYSAIHRRFAHSNVVFTGVNQSKACIFRYFLRNGEFQLIRGRHAFPRVYRRSVNHCSSNTIQWISPSRLNHTEGSRRILSHFPLPDRISTLSIILNKFIDAQRCSWYNLFRVHNGT